MDLIELSQIIPKPISQWQTADVQLWLSYIRCAQLQQVFKQAMIRGSDLANIDGQYLVKVLKIKSRILVKKLTNWINSLVKNEQFFMTIAKTKIRDKNLTLAKIQPEQPNQNNTSYWQANSETASVNSQMTEQFNQQKYWYPPILYSSNHTPLFLYEIFGNNNRFYVCDGRDLSLGKAAGNDICCADSELQLNHCEIVHLEGQHYLRPRYHCDVWKKITSKLTLSTIYIIQMGQVTLQVMAEKHILELRVIKGTNSNQNFSFNGRLLDNVRIGRKITCELCFQHDFTMSAFHGKFIYQGGQWYFYDLQTTNGSWWRLRGDQLISNGMIFRMGLSDCTYECRFEEQKEPSVSSVSEMGTCKKCDKHEKNSYMRPCYHSSLCYDCGLTARKCPLCQCDVTQVIKIFRE